MVSRKQHSRLIDRYLDGNLDEQELKQFKAELENNPEMQVELQMQKAMNEALKERDVIDLRARLQAIHQGAHTLHSARPMQRIIRQRTVQIAASAVILVAVTFAAIWIGNERDSNEALFERYYEKYDPVTVRTGSPEIDEIFQKALKAYENQEFEMAVVYFEEVLSMDRNRMEANLLTGASNLELEEYKEAEKSFNKVIDHNNNMFVEEAEWYLGFCYLKTNKTTQAMEQFKKFSESSSEKQEMAKKILRRLR